ncbi:MAG: hypothetical protein MUC83_12520 [Pirellula sp.]|jgi:hypothetical protein|nr:hypothetical protein [Pirellula sp.]
MSHLATETLDVNEREAWVRNLKIIERGRKAFWEFIGAVDEIRKKRLYRQDYKTFEKFAEEKVGIGKRYLNQLMEANQIRQKMGAIAPKTVEVFNSESQLAELKSVPESKLKEFVETVAEKYEKPTAKQIAEERERILQPVIVPVSKTIDAPSVKPVIDAVVPKRKAESVKPEPVAPPAPVVRPADEKDQLKGLLTKLDAVDALQIVLESLGTIEQQAEILNLHFGDLTKQVIESATVGVMESHTESDIEGIGLDQDAAQSFDNLMPQAEAITLYHKYGYAGREVIAKTIAEAWENEQNVYDGKKRSKNPRFVPPTVEEVAEFCRDRGNSIDAEAFVAYYAARGWKLASGTKVADWKQCVITWEKRDKKRVEHIAELSKPVDEMEEIRRRNEKEKIERREHLARCYAEQREAAARNPISPFKQMVLEKEAKDKAEREALEAKYPGKTPEEIATLEKMERMRVPVDPDFDIEARRKEIMETLAKLEAGEEITVE